MNPIVSRVCRARLLEQIYRLINVTEEKVTETQIGIRSGNIRVAWIEPDRLLDEGYSRLWSAEIHQGLAKPEKRARVIAVERDRRLELDPRFGQSVLNPTEHAHRIVRC